MIDNRLTFKENFACIDGKCAVTTCTLALANKDGKIDCKKTYRTLINAAYSKSALRVISDFCTGCTVRFVALYTAPI